MDQSSNEQIRTGFPSSPDAPPGSHDERCRSRSGRRALLERLLVAMMDIPIMAWGRAMYALFSLFGWRFVRFTGKVLGLSAYLFQTRKRRITARELASLFGGRFSAEQMRRMVRRSFLVYYQRHVETVFLGAMTRERVNRIMRVQGRANLDAALARKKGVILLLSHFGSFLLPLPCLGYMGYRVNQITGRQQHSSLLAKRFWLWRKREADRLPVGFLQVGKFLRPVFDALANNEIVAVAFDGRDGARWVQVPLFEKTALFSTGPFELAMRTGASIIPTFVVRGKDEIQELILEPAFELSGPPDAGKALQADMERFARRFADYVARYPCHFGMILYIMTQAQSQGVASPFFAESPQKRPDACG